MKSQFAFCLLFSVSTLLISCSSKEDSPKEILSSVAKPDSVVNFSEMSTLIKRIIENKDRSSFLEDNDVKRLEKLQKSLDKLYILSEAMKLGIKSAPIKFDTAVDRRRKFIEYFGTFANIFPQSFSFEIAEMKELIKQSESGGNNTIIRMYPVFDDRPFSYTDPVTGRIIPKNYRYSFAFIAADPFTHTQANYNSNAYVLDVLDPCPPPSGCHELKQGGPIEQQP